jgi:hypothetical protein
MTPFNHFQIGFDSRRLHQIIHEFSGLSSKGPLISLETRVLISGGACRLFRRFVGVVRCRLPGPAPLANHQSFAFLVHPACTHRVLRPRLGRQIVAVVISYVKTLSEQCIAHKCLLCANRQRRRAGHPTILHDVLKKSRAHVHCT